MVKKFLVFELFQFARSWEIAVLGQFTLLRFQFLITFVVRGNRQLGKISSEVFFMSSRIFFFTFLLTVAVTDVEVADVAFAIVFVAADVGGRE